MLYLKASGGESMAVRTFEGREGRMIVPAAQGMSQGAAMAVWRWSGHGSLPPIWALR